MPLEDHIGDICRKARMQTNTPITAVAAAAGVEESALDAWEIDGDPATGVNVAALAELLSLNVAKAAAVAEGWEPEPVDVGQWSFLRMITTAGSFEVNSFVIWDGATREAAVFDTGWFADDIFQLAEAEGLKMEHLFITHMHGDHVAAMGEVRKQWPGIQLHANNSGAPEKNHVQEGKATMVGGLRVTPRLTPGHAEDGVTYVIKDWPGNAPAVAMVGDAIFAGSMGKDFSTPELAQRKVREEILSLPPDTLICPGHGPLTTVEEELAHNPFF